MEAKSQGWTPKLSIAEVEKLLTAPGRMHEMENAIVDGRVLRVYKHLPPVSRLLQKRRLFTTVRCVQLDRFEVATCVRIRACTVPFTRGCVYLSSLGRTRQLKSLVVKLQETVCYPTDFSDELRSFVRH